MKCSHPERAPSALGPVIRARESSERLVPHYAYISIDINTNIFTDPTSDAEG